MLDSLGRGHHEGRLREDADRVPQDLPTRSQVGLTLRKPSVCSDPSRLAGGSRRGPSKDTIVVASTRRLLRSPEARENYVELYSGMHVVPDVDMTCHFLSSANDCKESVHLIL